MQAHTRLGVLGVGTKPRFCTRLSEHLTPAFPHVLSNMHLLPEQETGQPGPNGQTMSLDKWFHHQRGSSEESSFGTRLGSKDKKRHPLLGEHVSEASLQRRGKP